MHAKPTPRPLTPLEHRLVKWLLEHGTAEARPFLAQLGSLQVVSMCSCGCASIDFIASSPYGMCILSDYAFRDTDGSRFGIFLFACGDALAGLEVWSIDGESNATVLPEPHELFSPWNDETENESHSVPARSQAR